MTSWLVLTLVAGAADGGAGTLTATLALVNDAGVALKLDHAVVYALDEAAPSTAPTQEISQRMVSNEMRFVPDFVVLQRDQTLKFTNDKGVPHEVHSYNDANSFETDRNSRTTLTTARDFTELGTSLIACHLHGTMVGWVLTVPGPFSIANRAGAVTWAGQRCGPRRYRAWAAAKLNSERWGYGEADFTADPCVSGNRGRLELPVKRTIRPEPPLQNYGKN